MEITDSRSTLHPEHVRLLDDTPANVLVSYEDADGEMWHVGYEVDRHDLERDEVWVTLFELGGPPAESPSMRTIGRDVPFDEHRSVALEHAQRKGRDPS